LCKNTEFFGGVIWKVFPTTLHSQGELNEYIMYHPRGKMRKEHKISARKSEGK
jgi:hypothetical protein